MNEGVQICRYVFGKSVRYTYIIFILMVTRNYFLEMKKSNKIHVVRLSLLMPLMVKSCDNLKHLKYVKTSHYLIIITVNI